MFQGVLGCFIVRLSGYKVTGHLLVSAVDTGRDVAGRCEHFTGFLFPSRTQEGPRGSLVG